MLLCGIIVYKSVISADICNEGCYMLVYPPNNLEYLSSISRVMIRVQAGRGLRKDLTTVNRHTCRKYVEGDDGLPVVKLDFKKA